MSYSTNFFSVNNPTAHLTLQSFFVTRFLLRQGISESLAKEVEPSNIKVMIVEPSGFRTDWAGRSSDKILPEIEEYKYLASFIDQNVSGAHNEPGDPIKAAEIIIDQIENHSETLPLRLPLGKLASDFAISKYKQELVNFEKLQKLSISADQPK